MMHRYGGMFRPPSTWPRPVCLDRLHPHGARRLGDLGLMLVTLPVTVVGLLLTWALGKPGFVLLPSGESTTPPTRFTSGRWLS
jgi:ABC-type molybdate transport system permease subunit